MTWEHEPSAEYYYRAGDNNKFDLVYDVDSTYEWAYNPLHCAIRSFAARLTIIVTACAASLPVCRRARVMERAMAKFNRRCKRYIKSNKRVQKVARLSVAKSKPAKQVSRARVENLT